MQKAFGINSSSSPLIDKLHQAMRLWKVERRSDLIAYLGQHDLMNEPAFWKLAQALFEVLPRNEGLEKYQRAPIGA